jgi:hypothetical protein
MFISGMHVMTIMTINRNNVSLERQAIFKELDYLKAQISFHRECGNHKIAIMFAKEKIAR